MLGISFLLLLVAFRCLTVALVSIALNLLARDAVTGGVASTARIITGAALIIIVVFAGFARGQLVKFQQMGFGVAVALLLDATIVRTVILPSALTLLDHRSWYLPH